MDYDSIRTTDEPITTELWTHYKRPENAQSGTLDILRIVEETEPTGHYGSLSDDETYYRAELLYTTMSADTSPYEGMTMHPIARTNLVTRLDYDDEVHQKFRDCLDYARRHLTPREILKLLAGEPGYQTNGETGYEALRFFVLDGITHSIGEFSRRQGHGPSRYGRAVRERIKDFPDWIQRDILESERNIYEGNMAFGEDEATRLVELYSIEQELLDTDREDELTELVNEYNLPYDEYINGHFTAHDCPHCGEELIERPKGDDDTITLDCSDCDKQYEGVVGRDGGLVVERELTGGEE